MRSSAVLDCGWVACSPQMAADAVLMALLTVSMFAGGGGGEEVSDWMEVEGDAVLYGQRYRDESQCLVGMLDGSSGYFSPRRE